MAGLSEVWVLAHERRDRCWGIVSYVELCIVPERALPVVCRI
jgi:hypothetical protein